MSTIRGYLHGYGAEERQRLRGQALFLQAMVHDGLPFARSRRLLEVGCGVGAQTAILLARFPELGVTGIDVEEAQLVEARRNLAALALATGRYDLQQMNAECLNIEPGQHDAAFVCWVLEHVASPSRVLAELRRVLSRGAIVVCTEVHNATLFLHPTAPKRKPSGRRSTRTRSRSEEIPLWAQSSGTCLSLPGSVR